MKEGEMRAESILQTGKKCYITGRTDNLDCHHVYEGTGRRKMSDENGFWVWLTHDLHNGNDPMAVHNNPMQGYDLMLKQEAQRRFEEDHTRAEFMELVKKSYLWI
jgi:hypothetical protein